MRIRHTGLFLLVAFFKVFFDQTSKLWVVRQGSLSTINTGVAFGILGGSVWLSAVLLGFLAALILYWAYSVRRNQRPRDALVFGLLIGGGVGNSIDRFLRGGVVDFLYLGIGPRFNLADLFIVVAVLLVGWDAVRDLGRKRTASVLAE